MKSPFSPAPDPSCPRCKGAGFVVRPEGEVAHAEVCTCVPTCGRCQGTGKLLVEVEGVMRLGRCRCQMLVDRVRLFNAAGIPSRHHRATLGSFQPYCDDTRFAREEVTSWANGYRPGQMNRGLVMWGQVGRGKTHLMAGVLRRLIFRHGVACRFIEFSHLLAQLKEGFDAGRGESRVLEPLAQVEILAIDELGKGRNTEWELAVVDELISRRYNGVRCTLATTNYGPGDSNPQAQQLNLAADFAPQSLSDRVGPRVYSRLLETAIFVPVEGEDFRTRDQVLRAPVARSAGRRVRRRRW